MRIVPLVSTVRRASPRKRLWLAGGGLGLFLLTAVVGNGWIRPDRAVGRADLGHDFLAFYTAATFVRDGRGRELYDLDAVRRAEQATARAAGVDLGAAFGPWWNPPFYALALAPLARLPYAAALDLWRWVNVASLVGSAVLLGRLISQRTPPAPSPGTPGEGWGEGDLDRRTALVSRRHPHPNPLPTYRERGPSKGATYRSAALVLLLLATSMPFVQAIGHAQNTCTSLLLLSATVTLWRSNRPLPAGLVAGLLFYKPQLAAVVAGVMAVDLGGAAVAGLAITAAALLALNALALPGTLGDWLHRLPANVRFMQIDHPYLWDRHVTLKAFWRLLVQGTAAGEPHRLTTVLTDASLAAVAAPLAWTAWRTRGRAETRDRLITATVVATPLLMPFYFDYDLLLLAVPAALYAAGVERSRWLSVGWVALAAELYVNAPLAGRLHLIPAVLLLSGVAAASIRRVDRPAAVPDPIRLPEPMPLAAAA